jgi:hypothetical protein
MRNRQREIKTHTIIRDRKTNAHIKINKNNQEQKHTCAKNPSKEIKSFYFNLHL